MTKREPLLADVAMRAFREGRAPERFSPEVQRKTAALVDPLFTALQVAKKYVFEASAVAFLKDMLNSTPEVIVEAADFAIQPHNPLWIEFDVETYNGKTTTLFSGAGEFRRFGYLIHDGVVAKMEEHVTEEGEINVVWALLRFKMNHVLDSRPFLDAVRDIAGLEEDGGKTENELIDRLMWGGTYDMLKDDVTKQALRQRHSIYTPEPNILKPIFKDRERLTVELRANRGILRDAIGILLLLNRTSPHQHITEVKAGQQLVRNKVSPLMKHSVVALKLNPDPKTIFHIPGDGVWRRQHGVRGHFCMNRRAKTSFCNGLHEWQEVRPHIWQCSRCKGLKWWRKEHKRGNADKGTVTQQYNVTANKGKDT